MSDQPLSGKVGLDVTDFKTGLAEMNRSIRVIESGFRASAAALGDWGKSADGLELRIKALTGEIDLQKGKVAALQAEYARVAEEKGTTSKAAQDLEIRLNKETETLGKMELELGQTETALSEMGDESKETGKDAETLSKSEDEAAGSTGRLRESLEKLKGGLRDAATGFKDLGDRVLSVTKTAVLGLAAGITGAVAGIGAGVVKLAGTADEIVENAEKIGITVEQYQELQFIGEQTGTSVEAIGKAFSKTTKLIGDASGGNKEAVQTFKDLGVTVTDANGQLRSSQDVTFDLIAALGKMQDETQRDILAQQLFGKGFQELAPLINLGADGAEEMTKQARELGAVMGEDALGAAADLNDKIAALKAGFAGLGAKLLSAFIPIISKAADALLKWLASPQVQAGIDAVIGGIQSVIEAVRLLVTGDFRGGIFGLQEDDPVISTILTIRETILSLAQAVQAFVTETLIPFIKEHWEELKAALIAIGVVIGVVAPLFAVISAAIAALTSPITLIVAAVGLLAAAWAGNWGGIRDKVMEVWAIVQPVLQQVWEWLKVNIPIALEWLFELWKKDWEGIQTAAQNFWAIVQPLLQAAWEWLKVNVPLALETLRSFWVEKAWPAIQKTVETVWPVIERIFNALKDFILNTLIPTISNLYTQWTTVWWPTIQTVLENVWTVIKAVFEELGRWVNDNIIPWVEYLQKVWSETVWPAIQKAVEDVWRVIQPIWEGLLGWLEEKLPPALEGLQGIFETVMAGIDAAVSPIKTLWDEFSSAVKGFFDWISSHTFKFKIELPNLPKWAIPGSPLPIHTAWKNFAQDMSQIQRNLSRSLPQPAAQPAPQTVTYDQRRIFNLTPQVVKQGERSLTDEIRFLELMS